jgi:hypothetical protein
MNINNNNTQNQEPGSTVTSPQKADPMTTQLFMGTGKSSLLNRVQNSPAMPNTTFKGKSASMMKSTMNNSSVMGTTMDGTNGLAFDMTRASPFKDTISKGMITGIGLLN